MGRFCFIRAAYRQHFRPALQSNIPVDLSLTGALAREAEQLALGMISMTLHDVATASTLYGDALARTIHDTMLTQAASKKCRKKTRKEGTQCRSASKTQRDTKLPDAHRIVCGKAELRADFQTAVTFQSHRYS